MEPPEQEHDILTEDARESIAWRVKSAFYTPDEIVDIVSESIADDETENQITLSAAKRAVRSALALEWAAQLERQRSWPIDQPTVSEKLASAFSSLERNHQILARMNLACCQTCGVDEISGDRDEDVTRGYVFFHEQDTEGVVDGGDLHLAFGSFTKSERKNIDVGSIIVRSLRRAGLSVEWPENAGTRILVRCGEWRRRFEEMEDFEDVQDFDFEGDGSEDDSESEESESGSDIELEVDESEVEELRTLENVDIYPEGIQQTTRTTLMSA